MHSGRISITYRLFTGLLIICVAAWNFPTPIVFAEEVRVQEVAPENTYVPDELLITYKKNTINLETSAGQVASEQFADSRSLEKKEDLEKNNISLVEITDNKTVEQKIAELRKDSRVESVQPNFQYYPSGISTNDTYKDALWGLDNTGQAVGGISGTSDADIDGPEAWAIHEGAGSIVAVIDTGVAYNHPDLSSSMWDGSECKDDNGYTLGGCNHGYDYEDNDLTPLPTSHSHGTHVAGIIAAAKNNNAGIIGVAPSAKIMALKSSLSTIDNVKSINFAKQNGAKIINASWTGSGNDDDLKAAIESFPGIFITAAGNSGANNDEAVHQYPCDFPSEKIICVAATTQSDALAPFSNYGTSSGSVDVGAPGMNIDSAIADTEILFEDFTTNTSPALPTGWTTTGNWGTFDSSGNNILHSDASHHSPYISNADSTATSPAYNLSGSTGATISFLARCDVQYENAYTDYMILEYSGNGTTFTEKFKWDELDLDDNNYAARDGAGSASYYFNGVSIPSTYLTANFQFRFHWVTDNSDNTYDGCSVDNINITKFSNGSDEKYNYLSGTSMASPHVAGLAALVWGYQPTLTVAAVKDAIINTGDSLGSLSGKTVTGKRINAYNALQAVTPVIIQPTPEPSSGGGGGGGGNGGGGGGGGGEEPQPTPVVKKSAVLGTKVIAVSAADKKAKDFIVSKNVPLVVSRIFKLVFGKPIKPAESTYWKNRARTDKATETKLIGAMLFQKLKGFTIPPAPKTKVIVKK